MGTDITFEDIVEKTKLMLGDNYKEPDDTTATTTLQLSDVCEMVVNEAAQWTNQTVADNPRLLNENWPVIVKCACMAYLNRGAEGLNSQSELGQQNIYTDWVMLMHKQITNRRYVM